MPLSSRTAGLITEAAREYGHQMLSTELMKAGLADGDPGMEDRLGRPIPRSKRAFAAVTWARERHRWDDLLRLATAVLNDLAPYGETPDWLPGLEAALREDGYQAVAEEFREGFDWAPVIRRSWQIAPLGDEDFPLVELTSVLSKQLTELDFPVAANHFAQAFDSFTACRWEAANGQLRAAFEDVVIETAKRRFGWTGNAGGRAITSLYENAVVTDQQRDLLRGVWAISHKNGPHPGMSTEIEAQLRLQLTVPAIRYVLNVGAGEHL